MPNMKIIVFEATLPEPEDGDTELSGAPMSDRATIWQQLTSWALLAFCAAVFVGSIYAVAVWLR